MNKYLGKYSLLMHFAYSIQKILLDYTFLLFEILLKAPMKCPLMTIIPLLLKIQLFLLDN